MSPGTGRRTYTEDELQAALRDIQSGKLGTRRAAVIYGIPRSTLRNKVYKLTSERKQESHLASTAPLKIEEEVMDEDKELSGAEEEKEIEKTLQGPLLTMDDIVSNMENADVLRSVLQRSKEGSREFGEILQNFLLASQSILASQKTPEASALVTQMLPEILRRTMTEEQLFKLQHNGDSEKLRPSPSNSVVAKSEKSKSESDMEAEESSSNVILKIPSFRPSSKNGYDPFARSSVETTSSSIVSPPVSASESGSPPILPTGKSYKDVKDAIAQSITQKFQQGLEPRRPIIELDYKRSGYTPPLAAGGISVIKAQDSRQFQQQQQQHKLHQQQQQQNSSSSSSSAAGGKGTRPKRGKYRNYDRDSLVEAVRAVQRGEMSVHRAGSYYGVPHSTLEYKVKERHLMRPRKRDPKPNPVDEKIASLKQNDLRNSQEKMKPVIQAPKKFPPTSPNGMKLPFLEPGMAPLAGYNASPFPFWTHPGFPPIALDYGRNPSSFPNPNSEYFASQMMQKMQEDSSRTQSGSTTPTPLAKNTRHIAESLLDGTGSNGSFLDGIIRSSLESGVPTNEEKSPKEDRNLAPENMSNKALLDQLCRNSRLTPLSKAASTDASSGDESYRKNSSPINFAKGPNSQDEPMDASPCRQNDKDLPTIELSNDSNDESSSSTSDRKSSPTTTSTPATLVSSEEEKKPPLPPARIYLKPDLVNPENLKPEMLVRFREILPDLDRNGVSESVPEISASDNDMSQD